MWTTKAKKEKKEKWEKELEKGKWREHGNRKEEGCKEEIKRGESLAGQNKKPDRALKTERGKYGWWNNLETKLDKRDGPKAEQSCVCVRVGDRRRET